MNRPLEGAPLQAGAGPDRRADGDRPPAGPPAAGAAVKPPPDRLYGRQRSHALRPRQELLLAATLPRLRVPDASDPMGGFPVRPRRLWLEVGFGGGEHALAQIAAHPDVGLIACEVFEQGLCSLMSRLVAEGAEADGALPPNLRVWDGDARTLIRDLPAGCLDRLFLMFPDPWPKSRHAKRRFVHPQLLPALARAVREGGAWHIATDDPTYQAWVAEVLGPQPWFAVPPPVAQRPDGWPPTRYEAKAFAAGRKPLYWTLERTASPAPAAAPADVEDDAGPA